MSSNHNIQTSFLILISVQIFLPHVRSQASPPPGYPYPDFNPSIITIIVILVAALFLMALFTIYVRRQSTDANFSIRRVLSTRRPTAARGLDASVIDTFPTFVYSTVKPLKIGKGALECAVCLNEYEDEETLRLIPKCDHVFHPECIDAWLQSHVTCPVCRANLVVVPGEQNDDVSENNVVVNIQEQATGIESLDRDLDRNESVKLNESSIIPRVFEGFRSHSTGHSLVQPGENMERFTLRLPADVRKQVVNRALLNRMGGEGSGKKGYRTGGAISGRRKGFKRLESLDRVVVRSERWVLSRAPSFLSRALSFRSPRVASGNGEASTSSTTPKTVDKIPLNNFGPKSC